MKTENFPSPIMALPEAALPMEGAKAYILQGVEHQILFMEFEKDIDLIEHEHESQWGIVLEGKIELVVDGQKSIYQKGDRYFIPKGVKHSGRIYTGYADITFFDQKDRYGIKQ